MSQYKIAAIILAAGYSRRMGQPKALLKMGLTNFHDTILEKLRSLPFNPLMTVVGSAGPEIIKASQADKTHLFILNEQAEKGQLSSLQCALKMLTDDVDGCLVALVDHPLVKSETYKDLYEKICEQPQRIIIPVYNHKGGHPVYFGCNYFTSLLEAPLSKGARFVVENNRDTAYRWPVQDAGVLIDIDTPADYQTHL